MRWNGCANVGVRTSIVAIVTRKSKKKHQVWNMGTQIARTYQSEYWCRLHCCHYHRHRHHHHFCHHHHHPNNKNCNQVARQLLQHAIYHLKVTYSYIVLYALYTQILDIFICFSYLLPHSVYFSHSFSLIKSVCVFLSIFFFCVLFLYFFVFSSISNQNVWL